MNFDSQTSLRLISECLSLVDRFGARPIHVRSVKMLEQTLAVEVETSAADSTAVKSEIVGVMGALSGLDIPELFPSLEVRSFGVRAVNVTENDVMWIVSSVETARLAGSGQPIEWLARSIVQENTPDYRRAQADRHIGQIETALRDLIDHHGAGMEGENYIELVWKGRALEDVRERAGAEGHGPDEPRILLDYAYLPQLRDAIREKIDWFDDGCVPNCGDFYRSLTELNGVRRRVAHHRPVDEGDLHVCQAAALTVLGPVGRMHPDISADFFSDYWDEQVAEIINDVQRRFQMPSVPPRGDVSEESRQNSVISALEEQFSGIYEALDRVNQIAVPATRNELHRLLVAALTRWRDALDELVTVAKRSDLAADEAEAAHSTYESALEEVRSLRAEIQGRRLGVSVDHTRSGQRGTEAPA